MTTAYARAVSLSFGKALRPALMAGASFALPFAFAPSAMAACTSDGNANTCVLVIGPAGAGQEDIATGSEDGGAGADELQFSGAGLALNANAIGTTLGTPATVRFINFETARVLGGSDLTLTGAGTDTFSVPTWIIDSTGTLTVLGGNAIGDASALTVNGLFNVNETETVGVLSGAATGSIVVAGTKTLSAGGGGTTFAGVISGAGGFLKAGSGELVLSGANSFTGPLSVVGGQLTLTGDNSMSGAVIVAGGTLEIGHIGAIDNVGSVTINAGGQVTGAGVANYLINAPVTINSGLGSIGRLTGNATITGAVQSNGGLQPGNTSIPTDPPGQTVENPGQDMGQITIIGTYRATGDSAYVGMFVNLDTALPANGTPGTTHDFLTIDGDVLGTIPTNVFAVDFDTAADTGIETTGDGIQLIRVTGANNGTEFRQGNAINAGAYQYLLTYVPNYSGADDGYFLQSAVRDELVAHPALLSAGQAMVRHCFRDDQRIPDSPKGATYGRGWVGYHQGNTSFGADTGIEMDQDFNCTTGGMDWRMGYGWFGGISGGLGKTNADLVTEAGTGTLDGSARAIEAYASFTSSSLFVNLSAGYADMDWTYKGALLGETTASSSGFIGSAQAGVALSVAPFAVKLIGGVSYDDTSCGDSCFGFAVTEDAGLLEAKGTVRIDGVTWGGSIRPWASVSYSDVLSDGINRAAVGAVAISADTNDQLLALEAGLQTYLDENLALFADGGYHESLGRDITGYKGGVGLKLYW
jgi:autotransporter-associated beta strand protein